MSDLLADQIRAIADHPDPAAIAQLRRIAVQVQTMEQALDDAVATALLHGQIARLEKILRAWRTERLT